MRLATVTFPERRESRRGVYSRLCDALVASAARNSPTTPLELIEVAPDPAVEDAGRLGVRPRRIDHGRGGLIDNTLKMTAWNRVIQAAEDGEVVGLLDCDTVILRDLAPAESLFVDVAYTVRPPGSQFPFNSGVVFARIRPAVRDFFQRWTARQLVMLSDWRVHQPMRRKYGGMNQAALGEMMQAGAGVEVTPLLCEHWNCEDNSWALFDPAETRVLHIKGRLRKACLAAGREDPPPDLAHLVKLWRVYDAAAREA